MREDLTRMRFGRGAAPFPRHSVPLHAMLGGCGYSRETDESYDWHGLKRGDAEMALIQYTVAGHGMLEYAGKRRRIGAGKAMVLHFPYDNRYWLPHDSEKWDFLYVCLYGREIMRVWKDITGRHGPVVALRDDSPVVESLVRIVRKMQAGEVRSPFEASSHAYDLAMRLLDEVTVNQAGDERPQFIEDAIAFCRENFRRDVGVDDIARHAGYSRYHFTRLFKEWTGLAPASYVQDLRLRHSARLLAETSLLVKEVAAESGFADCNYFCRAFRKSFGVSPAQFRKSGMFR